MEQLAKKIKAYDGEVTFKSLLEFIKAVDINALDYEKHVNAPEVAGDYGRNILTEWPFECVLLNWPPQVESAIHHHKGLFGYVWILEGELDNHFYREEEGKLVEFTIDKYGRNGLIPEPDGVIHKLRNNSKTKRALSVHFYYPFLESFNGMRIFNTETGDTGILSDKAVTASWQEVEGHFNSVKRSAFQFISHVELNKDKTHIISNVIPKPDADRINEMNSEYFGEQAAKYDFSDFNHPKRKSYTDSIDFTIANDLKENHTTKKHLDIATGTGRRAIHIRELSEMDYEIVGVDISEEMCKIAESRGLRMYHQDWANDDTHTGEMFDSVSFLYAFGHLANEQVRIKTLKKIHSYLNDGGVVYIDFFNLNNKNEWGPLAVKYYNQKHLGDHEYQLGDIFYKKLGSDKIAFVHYFTIEEIQRLLESTGFEMVWHKNVGYAKNPGEITDTTDEGNFFVKARKVS